jgi:hypothetical protein
MFRFGRERMVPKACGVTDVVAAGVGVRATRKMMMRIGRVLMCVSCFAPGTHIFTPGPLARQPE